MKLSLSCELLTRCAGGLHIHCVNKAAQVSVWGAWGCLPWLLCGLMRWVRLRQGYDVNSWSITVGSGIFLSKVTNWVWQSSFYWEAQGILPDTIPTPTRPGSLIKDDTETRGRSLIPATYHKLYKLILVFVAWKKYKPKKYIFNIRLQTRKTEILHYRTGKHTHTHTENYGISSSINK